MALISIEGTKTHYKRQFWSFLTIISQSKYKKKPGDTTVDSWLAYSGRMKRVYANFSSNLPTGLQHFEFVDLTNFLYTEGQVMHICVNKLTNIGSDNGLLPDRRHDIIWTYAGLSLIGPSKQTETVKFQSQFEHFYSEKMHFNMSPGK